MRGSAAPTLCKSAASDHRTNRQRGDWHRFSSPAGRDHAFVGRWNQSAAQESAGDPRALASIDQAFDGRMEGFKSITKVAIFAATHICASSLFSEHDGEKQKSALTLERIA
jgi:hypothetical protein